jgi:hypothetical protein
LNLWNFLPRDHAFDWIKHHSGQGLWLFMPKVILICAQRDPLWPMRCDLGPKWSQFMTKVIPTFPRVIYAQSDPKWSPYQIYPMKCWPEDPGPANRGPASPRARKPAMGPYKPARARASLGQSGDQCRSTCPTYCHLGKLVTLFGTFLWCKSCPTFDCLMPIVQFLFTWRLHRPQLLMYCQTPNLNNRPQIWSHGEIRWEQLREPAPFLHHVLQLSQFCRWK